MFRILFCVTISKGLPALMLKEHIGSPILYRTYSRLFKALPLEYPVCSDWSAHTRLSLHRPQCLSRPFQFASYLPLI